MTLLLVVGLGAAWAQGQSSKPVSSTEQARNEQAADTAAETESAAEPDAAVADEVPEVPKEILEAIDKRDEVHATMERFVPTEKLSEDRAVSFPNDI